MQQQLRTAVGCCSKTRAQRQVDEEEEKEAGGSECTSKNFKQKIHDGATISLPNWQCQYPLYSALRTCMGTRLGSICQTALDLTRSRDRDRPSNNSKADRTATEQNFARGSQRGEERRSQVAVDRASPSVSLSLPLLLQFPA